MEPPPSANPPLSTAAFSSASAQAPASAAAHVNYPDSVDSSPRSRNTDSWEEPSIAAIPGGARLRLMCSYGGHIVPRRHDKSLSYVGGDTRIFVVDRSVTLSDLINRLSKTFLNGRSFTLKYQLPNEDLDSLISVTTDEDLENMIEEYDRLPAATSASQKSSRLRLFLFPLKPDSTASIGPLLENSIKSEDWFINALNGVTRGFSDSASVNSLLGLGDDAAISGDANLSAKDVEAQLEAFDKVKGVGGNSNKQGAQDVQSVPDSPMLEKTSSFGSASSSPSMANLPPIRVHVEDRKVAASGIDEQFSRMSLADSVHKQDDGGFSALSSPPTVPATMAMLGVPMGTSAAAGEYLNRVCSDDERSDQGMPVGYRKQTQTQTQTQPQPQPPPQSIPAHWQPKPSAGVDFPSPDSASSDGSITNPMSRQRPMIYQDPNQFSSGNNRVPVNPVDAKMSDPNTRVQMQQQEVQDSGYVFQNQFEQHQQLNQPQQQQFIQPGTHYIQHHPTGTVPLASYYPMYPSQQQHHHIHQTLDQQYPVYYLPAMHAQAYNLSMQQSNFSEPAVTVPSSQPQTHAPPAMISSSAAYNTARNAPPSKPELAAGVYRTSTTAAAPSLVQVPAGQHQAQYVGFSQIPYPSQSPSAATANYAYEFADHTHGQVYYAQPLAAELAAQYQTMTSVPGMVLPEASEHHPADKMKQQSRPSQPSQVS